jgi:hypothetical protein
MTEDAGIALFDGDIYQQINLARWALAQDVIRELQDQGAPLSTAYDFGAGPGWFANRLSEMGLNVVALEGRADVAREGQARAPQARFEVFDFDAAAVTGLPEPRDFSLCFGILYHLENPLRALRMMGAMTGEVMLLETMTMPSELAAARVIRENPNATQGIQPLAILLSPESVEQGLWAAGFTHVYRCLRPIDHDDFRDLPHRHPRRHVWLAARRPLSLDGFDAAPNEEPRRADYWRK